MACKVVKLKDGTTVIANMTRRGKLSDRDRQTLEEYAEYCRKRAADRQRKRNAALLPGARKDGRLS